MYIDAESYIKDVACSLTLQYLVYCKSHSLFCTEMKQVQELCSRVLIAYFLHLKLL